MRYVPFLMNELLTVSESNFIGALFKHTENRTMAETTADDQAKIDSWKDCRFFLQRYIKQAGLAHVGDFPVCFEYQIFDGTWIDAVIVCQNKLILLEFKSGTDCSKETLDGHRAQVNGYYNKVTRCNRVIWQEMKQNPGFTVEKYLIYTNAVMADRVGMYDYICVCDEFEAVMNSLTVPATTSRVLQLLEFDEELDITTIGVMRDILHRRVLSEMYVQDSSVTACEEIVDQIQKQPGVNLNLIFIKGAPGAGKTGTAFSLLERYMDRGAKYVTGNGNLSSIFRQMIREDKISGTEAAIVGSLHDLYDVSIFCRRYMENDRNAKMKFVSNRLLIVDEAQRVWNPIQIALAKKNKLNEDQKAFIIRKDVSEAMLVLRAVLQGINTNKKSQTVVFLLGSGQEIYIGEEEGESYILKAVQHIQGVISQLKERIGLHIYVPTDEMQVEYSSYANLCEKRSGLLLAENKRSIFSLEFINALIDEIPSNTADVRDAFFVYDDYHRLLKVVKSVPFGAFSRGLVINGFETVRDFRRDISFYRLSGLDVYNISNQQLKSFYIDKSCNALTTFASQFNCQGLELDYIVMIWGRMMLWRRGKWEFSDRSIRAVDNYCSELNKLVVKHPELSNISVDKEELRKIFIKNCYRVLLTRARCATFIYIDDPETYRFLKSIL